MIIEKERKKKNIILTEAMDHGIDLINLFHTCKEKKKKNTSRHKCNASSP